jgi:hypothetical protein
MASGYDREVSKQECAQLLRQGLGLMKGDDLERAEAAFKNMTPKQLDTPYGLSSQTPREILTHYREQRQKFRAAEALLNALLLGAGLR